MDFTRWEMRKRSQWDSLYALPILDTIGDPNLGF